MHNPSFALALRERHLSPFFDATASLLTCERTWRRAFVEQIEPSRRDTILDFGCGTGALAIMLKRACPSASVHGADCDPDLLIRAEAKARDAEIMVHFARTPTFDIGAAAARVRPTKIVLDLVLRRIPLDAKAAMIRAAFAVLPAGGELHVADYGLQSSPLMRFAYRQVRSVDEFTDGAELDGVGILPGLMTGAGFRDVGETRAIPTPTGSISLYAGYKI